MKAMRGSYLLPLVFAPALAAQDTAELRSPGDVLKVQPFVRWAPKKAPHRFLVAPPAVIRDLPPPASSRGTCSIPLITITPEPMDQQMARPVPKGGSNMPQVVVPSPACKDWPMR